MQDDLFGPLREDTQIPPLAHQQRPKDFAHFLGQDHIFLQYRFLKHNGPMPSFILWGPPGTGKTTLAHLAVKNRGWDLVESNAVLDGVAELKEKIQLIQKAIKKTVLFIDEIHRFNKAQQDVLLPFVEKGLVTLIGATTENPKFVINRALLSRVLLVELKALTPAELTKILQDAPSKVSPALRDRIASFSGGDARLALSALEMLGWEENLSDQDKEEKLKSYFEQQGRFHDRAGGQHYDVISAFIKSVRGSDADAAVLYLGHMLENGEDPRFIARRLLILASEDIGNADPMGLVLSEAGLRAVEHIGMPEARLILSQVTTYLASTHKSNASYLAINQAIDHIKQTPQLKVPSHLLNNAWGKEYLYPHDYPGHYVKQKYTDQPIPNFYRPTDLGEEKKLRELISRRGKE